MRDFTAPPRHPTYAAVTSAPVLGYDVTVTHIDGASYVTHYEPSQRHEMVAYAKAMALVADVFIRTIQFVSSQHHALAVEYRTDWSFERAMTVICSSRAEYEGLRYRMRLYASTYAMFRGWTITYTSPRIYRAELD
jgi:hypothetical protein